MTVSQNFTEILGYPAGEIGQNDRAWKHLVHPADRAALERAVEAAGRESDDVPPVEFRLRLKDGSFRWFYTRPTWRESDEGGALVLVSGVTLDIHDRKEAEQERERLMEQVAAERARALAILEQMPASVVLAAIRSGNIFHYNSEAQRQFGPDLALIGDEAFKRCELVRPDGSAVPAEGSPLSRAMLRGETVKGEEFHCQADVEDRYFSVNAGRIEDRDGVARVAVAMSSDIQALKRLHRSLIEEKGRALVTLSSIGDAVVSTDAEGAIVEFNPAAERLTGWRREDAVGRFVSEVLHIVDKHSRAPLDGFVASCLSVGRATDLSPCALLVPKAGPPLSIEDVAAPIRLPDGSISGLVIIFRDVTESRRMLRSLTHQATHDALTGLVNRVEFESRIERALEHAAEFQTESALLYMDLDQFKIVNDSCGHKAGDELLRQLSQRFRAHMRERDTLARLGGDEFGLLIEHCSMDEAVRVAQKVLETTREIQFPFGARVFRVGVSIGLVPITASSQGTQQVMQRADHACYIAKESGRNRVHIQREDDAQLAERQSDMNWVSLLGDALHDDGLQLFFQPIVPVGRKDGLHCEILLRLREGPGQWIPPGLFLPAAERYDIMSAVDRWVLRHTVDWLEAHPEHLSELDLCAINLSARTLTDEQFQQYAIEVLDTASMPTEKRCFEITETAAIAQLQKTGLFIDKLKKHGCRFALDDFGTGMASFSYLKKLPVDFIKIDGSFVSAMRESAVDAEMVKSVNQIGHIMGKQTVVEWVTDEPTMDLLTQFGVDFVQGYWISPPQPLSS